MPIVIGVMWAKWATPLKLVRQKISGMSKIINMWQWIKHCKTCVVILPLHRFMSHQYICVMHTIQCRLTMKIKDI